MKGVKRNRDERRMNDEVKVKNMELSCLQTSLNSKRLIDELQKNGDRYADIKESKSLVALYQQQLFIWNDVNSCVLCVPLLDTELDTGNNLKVLLPTCTPVFQVECVLINRIGTLLALIGKNGIMIIEIPWHYGQFHSSTSNDVFCKSWNVAERFFICTSRVDIVQASWHPGSSTCTHIMVLSTDNYLRLYDAIDSQTPIQVVQLGSGSDCHFLTSSLNVTMQACLGESAVSFDFGPPESYTPPSFPMSEKASESTTVWPVYTLYGNGDVYVVKMGLKKSNISSLKVEGPLAMFPSAEDNYGVDACCMICIHSNPPVLIIAMASGIIYHCILLDSLHDSSDRIENEFSFDSSRNSGSSVALYVHGSVELPMALTADDLDYSYGQSVWLYKDVVSLDKYHCSLVGGIYSVQIPLVHQLAECGKTDNLECIVSRLQENDSIVEHLLCTQPLSSVKKVPILGLATFIENKGMTMICLLASWEFICLPVLSSTHCFTAPLLSSLDVDSEDQITKSGFEQQIQHLLARPSSTPILKSCTMDEGNTSSTKQWLELLCSTTQRFREEYIKRLCTIQAHTNSRAKILMQRKDQQIAEIQRKIEEKKELSTNAEKLAEKYDDASVRQKSLLERIEEVLKLLQKKYPIVSTAEVKMKHDLIALEDKIKALQVSFDQIKKKHNFQKQRMQESKDQAQNDSFIRDIECLSLNEVQQRHIKEILHQEGKTISKLVKTVTMLKSDIL